MGCTASVKSTKGIERNTQALKAAILIQSWFRRHQARLEARGRCTWKIFQAIEYVGEQDQMKVCNFFNGLIKSQQGDAKKLPPLTYQDTLLDIYADPSEIEIYEDYTGPQISIPIDLHTIWEMIHYFERGQILHAKHVLLILRETRNKLRKLSNINKATTNITRQITICGDLHGSFDDLMTVFQKNSAPSFDNPYIFNGDLVDRGTHSVEVVLIVFSFFILYSNRVYINRGNHEDYIMNARYGFYKEIMSKYKSLLNGSTLMYSGGFLFKFDVIERLTSFTLLFLALEGHAAQIVRIIEDVFSWLPLATIIDDEILVVHGGVSDMTNLKYIDSINRHKYVSILKPGFIAADPKADPIAEWRQMLDLLWSDPCSKSGCTENKFRGVGCYFGPDVTHKILEKHNLKLLVRSHECVVEGHRMTHDGKVVTVFSASSYYEKGSNNGAYMKILPNIKPYFVEYSEAQDIKDLSFVERVSKVEESAIRELRKIIFSHKDLLLREFKNYECGEAGLITVLEWTNVMKTVLNMSLPWSMIKKQMSLIMKDGKVDYKSFLDRYDIESVFSKKANLIETLYRHRNTFETIFRIIDKNNSGLVSLEKFQECCEILCQHTKAISKQDIKDLALTIDANNDGNIDFNEFLEAFRLCEKPSL